MEPAIPHVELARWQTATLVASAVAALELVLVVVLGIALLLPDGSQARDASRVKARAAEKAAPPVRETQATKPALARARTSILVLNGNGVTGAAAEAAERVRVLGYRVEAVGNAPTTGYARSLVLFRPGREPEAKRLARDVRVALVAPLDGLRVRQLGGAHLVLVLGGS